MGEYLFQNMLADQLRCLSHGEREKLRPRWDGGGVMGAGFGWMQVDCDEVLAGLSLDSFIKSFHRDVAFTTFAAIRPHLSVIKTGQVIHKALTKTAKGRMQNAECVNDGALNAALHAAGRRLCSKVLSGGRHPAGTGLGRCRESA